MNKTLLTLAVCVAIGGASLSAAVVTIDGSDAEYASISAAMAEAQTGATILVHESYTEQTNINPGTKTITIKGDDGVVVSYKGQYVITLDQPTASLTVENLTFKNVLGSTNTRYTFAFGKGSIYMTNVTIQDADVNHANGVIFINSTSNLLNAVFDNVKIVDAKVTTAPAEVVLNGNNNVILKGDCKMSIQLKNKSIIKSASEFTGHADLVLDGQDVGATLVNNCTNAALFSLVDADEYKLVPNDGNLVLAENIVKTVENVNTGAGFETLADAVSAANDGETLQLNDNIEFTARVAIGNKNLTIKGATGQETITRKGFVTYYFLMTANCNLTLENLVLDGGEVECTASMQQPAVGSKLTLNNVEVTNCITSNARGLIDNSTSANSGTWHLNNVRFTNCSVPYQEVTSNANGNSISGDNSFTLRINSTAANGDYYIVDASGINNTVHQEVTLDRALDQKVAISNCNQLWQFWCTNSGWMLDPVNNNLVVMRGTQTGVDDIEIESNDTPEYWYNLNGMRLVEKPTTSGFYIRRSGDKSAKVFVK